jgi:carbonic anhydrase
VKDRPGHKPTNLVIANVERSVSRLKGLDPILKELVDTEELKVVGEAYELRTGAVEVFA